MKKTITTTPPNGALIIQSDRSILIETAHDDYEVVRDKLAVFAELVKSPEHIHTYKITNISLWNACAAGASIDEVIAVLTTHSRYDIPQNIIADIHEYMSRYGSILLKHDATGALVLKTKSVALMKEIVSYKNIRPLIGKAVNSKTVHIPEKNRGTIKQLLIKHNFPVEDLAGYTEGAPLSLGFRERTISGEDFNVRSYQDEAATVFYAGGGVRGGSGVITLPCGAGKTIVGLQAMVLAQTQTLILVTNVTAARQWRAELLNRTTLTEHDIGEYSGERKEIKPVTIATYQILTYRKKKTDDFKHFALFHKEKWGLIIYDEVHLLPAPVFRECAHVQSRRRLGLTATLVREDGLESDVFSLIGPKKYDVPWKDLEKQGWIASAQCYEYRVPLPEKLRMKYAVADIRKKFRIASENPRKLAVARTIIKRHADENILIIGMYLEQLDTFARELNAPVISGKTPYNEREVLFNAFRTGTIKVLIVSRVANFAVDLPDAGVAIQVSGLFGSRQEEAQRLGRILRPKSNNAQAYFYSLISQKTNELDYAARRQLFLTEQGYRYTIMNIKEEADEKNK